ncbi:MAG: dTMP kinase [Burkholderiales bacterium]|nr:dTMP kinase [Burkholderiales bacterium]
MKNRGLFISVEGIDGVGKSTHVPFIANYLRNMGLEVVTTREPGGTEYGENIRDILLHGGGEIHRITELFLMFASRQELIHNFIIPNISNGVCVVADRFIDSSVAYQGAGREIGVDKIKQIVSILEPQINTDLTLLFDTPLSVATGRLEKNIDKDRIEKETDRFFTNVQSAYHNILQEEPERVKLINTDQSVVNTRLKIIECIDELVKQIG